MAWIAYDDRDAAAFAANRHVDDDGLTGWREAVARQLNPRIEPATAMRARLRRAAEVELVPVIDAPDLLVLDGE